MLPLNELRARLSELVSLRNGNSIPERTRREAIAWTLERAAWIVLGEARDLCFEKRLGIPKTETAALDLLRAEGILNLEQARRYRNLSELRKLSQREWSSLDTAYLDSELALEFELLEWWEKQISCLLPPGHKMRTHETTLS